MIGAKTCSQCGKETTMEGMVTRRRNKDGKGSICRVCDAANGRRWRQKNREHKREVDRQYRQAHPEIFRDACRRGREASPEKYKARYAVDNEMKAGRLYRPGECLSCGAECVPDGHHEDYSKPLEVVWLCRMCHLRGHKEQREAL